MSSQQYKAFICHSSLDSEFVDELEKELTSYIVPKNLHTKYPKLPKKLSPIFRDKHRLSVGESVKKNIIKAINNTDNLIVVCSKHTAKGNIDSWVNQEIIAFKKLHNKNKIIPIIIEGIPFAEKNGNSPDEECYPLALRFNIDSNGKLTKDEAPDILGSNISEERDGKKNAFLKVIAGILEIGTEEFFDFYEENQKKERIKNIFIWSLIVTILTLITAFALFQRNDAIKQKNKTQHQIGLVYSEKAQTLMEDGEEVWAGYYAYKSLEHLIGHDSQDLITKLKSIIIKSPIDYCKKIISHKSFNNQNLLSPDGRYQITYKDSKLHIWDLEKLNEKPIEKKLENSINKIRFSQNSTYLVVLDRENNIVRFKLENLLEKPKILSLGKDNYISKITFLPNTNFLAYISPKKKYIDLINIENLNEQRSLIFDDHKYKIHDFSFSLNGKYVLTRNGNEATLWNFKNISSIIMIKSMKNVKRYIFSEDERYFITYKGKNINVYDLTKPNLSPSILNIKDYKISSLEVSPDSKYLVASSVLNSAVMYIWDLNYLDDEPKKIFLGSSSRKMNFSFTQDSNYLIVTSGKLMAIYNVHDFKLKNGGFDIIKGQRYNNGDFDKQIYANIISRDSKNLITYTRNDIKIWDLNKILKNMDYQNNTSKEIFNNSINGQYKVHSKTKSTISLINLYEKPILLDKNIENFNSYSFSKKNRYLVANSNNNIYFWDTKKPSEKELIGKALSSIIQLTLSPGGSFVCVRTGNGIRLMSTERHNSNHIKFSSGRSGTIHTFAFSPDEEYIVTYRYNDNRFQVWDLKNPNSPPQDSTEFNGTVLEILVSKNGEYIIVDNTESIQLWDSNNITQTPKLLPNSKGKYRNIAVSPNDSYLAASSFNGIKVWHLKDIKDPINLYEFSHNVYSLSFSPDNRYLAVGTDFSILIWDIQNPTKKPVILRSRQRKIDSLTFLGNGEFLVSGEAKYSKKIIWDLNSKKQLDSTNIKKVVDSSLKEYIVDATYTSELLIAEMNNTKIRKIIHDDYKYHLRKDRIKTNNTGDYIVYDLDGKIYLLNMNTDNVKRKLLLKKKSNYQPFVSIDGDFLSVCYRYGHKSDVYIFNLKLQTGNPFLISFKHSDHQLHDVVISPNGKFLAINYKNKIELFNIPEKKKKLFLKYSDEKNRHFNYKFSPNEKYLSARTSKDIRLYNIEEEKLKPIILECSGGDLIFSNNGSYMTCMAGQNVLVYKVSKPDSPILNINTNLPGGTLYSYFSQDNKYVYVSSYYNRVKKYRLDILDKLNDTDYIQRNIPVLEKKLF